MPTTIMEWSIRLRGYVTRDTITAGEARAIIAACRAEGLPAVSHINPSLTGEQAADILSKGIHLRGDNEPIPSIVAKHIHREFVAPSRRRRKDNAAGATTSSVTRRIRPLNSG